MARAARPKSKRVQKEQEAASDKLKTDHVTSRYHAVGSILILARERR
jgi:hypothetical protein